jgi:acetylglutamate kinase
VRVLVKIGGAQLEQDAARATFASAVAEARAAGHELILVHGGGDQIKALAERLNLDTHKVDGLRVTDEATAEVVLAVLGGTVNRRLVASLDQAGQRAVGLTGADGGLFQVERHTPGGRDLGYVGQVCAVDTTVVEALLAAGVLPVIASVAPLAADRPGPRDQFYNVNADAAAGPLSAAFQVDAVLFLTDVPAVLGAEGEPLASLDPNQAANLRAQRVLSGGMLPKLEAAFAAAAARPQALVRIASAVTATGVEGAILSALADGVGTTLRTGSATHG